jgi:RNA polymerase sigma-70 factor (ECF subfamily)
MERQLVAKLTHAYEVGDVDALVALLTEDVLVSMPPLPLEYEGLEMARRFHDTVVFRNGRRFRMVPTRANGQPAFGAYQIDAAGGPSHAIGLIAVTLAGDHVRAITRFDTGILGRFGLPRSLPA